MEAEGRGLNVRNLERDGTGHPEGNARGQDKSNEEDERDGPRQSFNYRFHREVRASGHGICFVGSPEAPFNEEGRIGKTSNW